ncbi:MAG: ferredoxin family protein [Methanobacteriota archaeon]|nr:MAG: ferredoxin family protein [Euryarchaeota archaeon]
MPIDEDFKDKLSVVAQHPEYGYDIWGEYNPPEKLGIHGSRVAVDFDICIGDGACVDVCPEEVFEWVEYPGHPASDKKAAPARESDCIECLACEDDCPVVAIKIFPE